jgi:2,3-bisphosphoglycerate-independent phosphoglycerate mutase
MDRDKRWDRVEQAFQAICHGNARFAAESAAQALAAAYTRGENDEFVQATVIRPTGSTAPGMQDGDVVVFMNFRADRARELTLAFTEPAFDGFERGKVPALASFVTLTEYAKGLKVQCAFGPESLDNGLGEYLSGLGKTQLRIAETEKYAHVTFFFSGGREQEYPGETRILVPSPKVATYDLQPEMSAYEVTDKLVEAIHARRFDAIICNFANGDMVGHTGVLEAAIKAVEVLDACLGRIVAAVLEERGICLITADHGNVEQMRDPESGQAMTSHTKGPVPLVCVSRKHIQLVDNGSLCDVAPTLLDLMQVPVPPEMTGHSLIAGTPAPTSGHG